MCCRALDALPRVLQGGTWEHRKRAMEMAITAQKAFDATKTRFDGGRQHLANYLPPEALQVLLTVSVGTEWCCYGVVL